MIAEEPDEEGEIGLPSGRTLGYAAFGVGEPAVLWMHGTPGARRQVPPSARRLAASRGLRVIGIERPGIGASTPHLYSCIREFADDVGVALDALGIARCVIVGLSGGGPYALACAHSLAQVRACGVLGGIAPSRGREAIAGGVSTLAQVAPLVRPLRRPLGAALSVAVRSARPLASPAFDLFMRYSRPSDREVFAEPGMKDMFLDDILRGSRTPAGIRSFWADYLLFSRFWGFYLSDVQVPVHFWQGDSDPFVSLAHGQHQAELVPGATLQIQPGHSHLIGLSIAAQVIETVLDSADLSA